MLGKKFMINQKLRIYKEASNCTIGNLVFSY